MTDAHVLADELTVGIRTALGDAVVAVWLLGSLVAGDFDSRASDLDLVAALRDDVDDVQLARLGEVHERLVHAHPDWKDRVDVVYASTQALGSFRERRSPLVVISPGEPLHRVSGGVDWLITWHRVRLEGLSLFGPPPALVIAPTSEAEFALAVRNHVAWMPARTAADPRPAFHAYAVLTACRGLHTCLEGEHVSKVRAAAWAAERHPEWSLLIERALAVRHRQYERSASSEPPLEGAAAFLDFAVRALSA